MDLLSKNQNNDTEDQSPDRAVRNDFEWVSRLEKWPIEWKEPPQNVGTETEEQA